MQYWSTYNFLGYLLMKTNIMPICSPLKTSLIITSVIGGYMTYIYPRKFVIKYNDFRYDLDHKYIMLFDFLIHQLPLIDIITKGNEIELCGRHIIFPMLLWNLLNNIYIKNTTKIYGISFKKMFVSSFGIYSFLGIHHHIIGNSRLKLL
jgi:hypothetical protein